MSKEKRVLRLTTSEVNWIVTRLTAEIKSFEVWENSGNDRKPHRRKADVTTFKRIVKRLSPLGEKDLEFGKYEPTLFRKECKVLFMLIEETLDNLNQVIIPEYWRRINENESTREMYYPYIEKGNRLRSILLNLKEVVGASL